jgi:hypothetical protein
MNQKSTSPAISDVLNRDQRVMGLVLFGLLTSILVTVTSLPGQVTERDVAQVAIESRPSIRLGIIGASASDGFGLNVRLADAIGVRLDSKMAAVEDYASSNFFFFPDREGKNQIEQVLKSKPHAVFAADYLFWFGYGRIPDEDRLAKLEKGLALLGQLELPVIAASLPDMRASVGKMLRKEQVPSKETLAKLNARIAEWAGTKKNVVLVPIAEALERMRTGEDPKLKGMPWPNNAIPALLQDDQLHPTIDGLAVLAELCLDGLRSGPSAMPKGVETKTPVEGVENLKELAKSRAEEKATPKAKVPPADKPVPVGK